MCCCIVCVHWNPLDPGSNFLNGKTRLPNKHQIQSKVTDLLEEPHVLREKKYFHLYAVK